MANLAILGHSTRGREVIAILEMLGGKNTHAYLNGNCDTQIYHISTCNNEIVNSTYSTYGDFFKVYSLEEFLKKFPYKAGDKVRTVYGKIGIIRNPIWSNRDDCIKYELEADTDSLYRVNELQPYKEENVEEINIDRIGFNGDRAKFTLPNGYEFKIEGNEVYIVKKICQYPKTYEECCKVLGSDPKFYVDTHLYSSTLETLYKLLICRDAYWKIAGEQMGLGKPWEPDWGSAAQTKYCITVSKNNISLDYTQVKNRVLVFPTEEMRDAFYENFKELIESVKELL